MEKTNPKKRKNIYKKLRLPYLLSLKNTEHGNEVFHISINRLGVFAVTSVICALFIVLIFSLVLGTPLRTLLPGYLQENDRTTVVDLRMRLDSVAAESQKRAVYFQNIQAILLDQVQVDSIMPLDSVVILPVDSLPKKTEREILFTKEFEAQEKFNLTQIQPLGISQDAVFQPPVKGVLAEGFDKQNGQYAQVLLCANKAIISAPEAGSPIAITQTLNKGYEIIMQHTNGYVSVFKQIARPMCVVGQKMEQGAIVGEMATKDDPFLKPILYYELWYRGEALAPQDYIRF